MGRHENSGQTVEGYAHVGEHASNMGLVYNVDSNDYAIARATGQARKMERENFDPYGMHNDQKNDPVIEAFSDLALNTPLPEKFPDLTEKEKEFAKAAADLLTKFADNYPKPAAADALTGLIKQFGDTRVSSDVVNAINLLLDEQHLKHPVRLGLSDVTGLLCLGTDDGDGHFTRQFYISDNRGIKRS